MSPTQPSSLHESTFDYLRPTDKQVKVMEHVRSHGKAFAELLEMNVPPGADRTYLLRKLREVVMWANVAITRNPDGSPRLEEGEET